MSRRDCLGTLGPQIFQSNWTMKGLHNRSDVGNTFFFLFFFFFLLFFSSSSCFFIVSLCCPLSLWSATSSQSGAQNINVCPRQPGVSGGNFIISSIWFVVVDQIAVPTDDDHKKGTHTHTQTHQSKWLTWDESYTSRPLSIGEKRKHNRDKFPWEVLVLKASHQGIPWGFWNFILRT